MGQSAVLFLCRIFTLIHVRVRTQVATFNRDCDLLYYLEIFKNPNLKGQLILKRFLVSSLSSKKQTKTSRQVVKLNFFARVLEETVP